MKRGLRGDVFWWCWCWGVKKRKKHFQKTLSPAFMHLMDCWMDDPFRIRSNFETFGNRVNHKCFPNCSIWVPIGVVQRNPDSQSFHPSYSHLPIWSGISWQQTRHTFDRLHTWRRLPVNSSGAVALHPSSSCSREGRDHRHHGSPMNSHHRGSSYCTRSPVCVVVVKKKSWPKVGVKKSSNSGQKKKKNKELITITTTHTLHILHCLSLFQNVLCFP